MKYKNTIIVCKKENAEELQQYLFKLKYHWINNGFKNRESREFKTDFCIIIRNDRSIESRIRFTNGLGSSCSSTLFVHILDKLKDFKILYYPQFIRKEKLKKLNDKQGKFRTE